MRYLFVHNNFPAQFEFAASTLAADPSNVVAAIGSQTARSLQNVRLERYSFVSGANAEVHAFARRFDQEVRRSEAVIYAISRLKAAGFEPDIVVAHSGWGEALPLRSAYPNARIIAYSEYCYNSIGGDVGFDPEFPVGGIDSRTGLFAKNAMQFLALAEADAGLTPTEWQRSTFPLEFRKRINVIHEGVDTSALKPDDQARWILPSGATIRSGDEVVTFVARNLEPLRGYHIFMRALPQIMAERLNAHVVIIGGDQVSYGVQPSSDTWKEIFLREVSGRLDLSRIHFLGSVPHATFVNILKISAVHVYFSYPFVLSWSLLEAMSCGCLIVASDTEPVREVIRHGDNGLLSPFLDIEQLSRTVVDALESSDEMLKLRRNARDTVVQLYDRNTVCLPKLLDFFLG